tara:strand:+ start:433 stop:618 length:186 start_codon:yes stop_codon:yes gene_type:complete
LESYSGKNYINNIYKKTVNSFGKVWTRFDQTGIPDDEAKMVFQIKDYRNNGSGETCGWTLL